MHTGLFRFGLDLLMETARGWSRHKALRMGAALAYYSVFALAPLLVIVVAFAGFWFGEDAARHRLFEEISGLMGPDGAKAIESAVASARHPTAGVVATVAASVTLILGATGVLVELQGALNTIWEVRRTPGKAFRYLVRDRILSMGMILAIGFLLLISLIISTALAAFGRFMLGLLPAQQVLLSIINFIVSLGVITTLFAFILKILPDARPRWRDVGIGAFLTALLFNLGKAAFGIYMARSSVASVYGAAASWIVVLLWTYYSSQILFLGAEFTRALALRLGSTPRLAPGAEFIPQEMGEVPEPREIPVVSLHPLKPFV